MGKSMEVWMEELGTMSPVTARNYLSYFKRFCERWEVTPERLYEMRLENLKSGDPRDAKRIERMVKTTMHEMQREGLAAGTCQNVWKAVRSFFEAQGLELSLKAKDKPSGQANGQRLILPDQIREVYDFIGWEFRLRNQALVMFAKDSGLRIGDMAALNVGDYENAVTKYNERGEKFKVIESFPINKTGSWAMVHIGPEAIEAVDAYLEERRGEEVYHPLDSPLFAMREGRRFNSPALSAVFYRLCKKMGKEGRKVSAHSFRKFHNTMLEATMAKNWVAKLVGRTIRDSTAAYSQVELLPGELTEAYMRGYDRLRIFGPSTEEARRDAEIAKLNKRLEEQEELIRALGQHLGRLAGDFKITQDNLTKHKLEKVEVFLEKEKERFAPRKK